MFRIVGCWCYALRNGRLLEMRPRRRHGRWRVRLLLPELLLPRPWPRLQIVYLLVMFKILVIVRYALRHSYVLVRFPRRRHVAGRLALPLPALLLLLPLELLVVLATPLVIARSAL